jgi:hypothetical protein
VLERIVTLMLEDKAKLSSIHLVGEEVVNKATVSFIKSLTVFENLDEIAGSGDASHALVTLQFIDFCYRNFAAIQNGKKELVHFMVSTICFFIKSFQKTANHLVGSQILTEKEEARLRVLSGPYDVHKTTGISFPSGPAPAAEVVPLTKESVGKILENSRSQLSQYLASEVFVRTCDAHFLILVFDQVNLFEEKVRVMEANGRKAEIVREYFSNDRVVEAIKFCEKYEKEPHLAMILIKLLSAPSNDLAKQLAYSDYLSQTLSLIARQGVYQPQIVLRILRKNERLPWKAVKMYLSDLINQKQTQITALDRTLQQNVAQIDDKTAQIHQFQTKPFLVQPNICALCKGRMNNPAIYFLCGHFYHKNCVYENSCPECVS